MSKAITGTVPAYVYAKARTIDPAMIHAAANASQDEKDFILSHLTITSAEWIKEDGDYAPVGVVEMKFTPNDTGSMVRGQVAALQAQRNKVLADAQRHAAMIQDQISKLQALTFDADEAMAGEQEID